MELFSFGVPFQVACRAQSTDVSGGSEDASLLSARREKEGYLEPATPTGRPDIVR
jgi:hypothetical protein